MGFLLSQCQPLLLPPPLLLLLLLPPPPPLPPPPLPLPPPPPSLQPLLLLPSRPPLLLLPSPPPLLLLPPPLPSCCCCRRIDAATAAAHARACGKRPGWDGRAAAAAALEGQIRNSAATCLVGAGGPTDCRVLNTAARARSIVALIASTRRRCSLTDTVHTSGGGLRAFGLLRFVCAIQVRSGLTFLDFTVRQVRTCSWCACVCE